MRSRQLFLNAIGMALFVGASAPAVEPLTTTRAATSAASNAANIEETFTAPLDSPRKLQALIEQIDAELRALAPHTRPTTSQPTTRPDADIAAQLEGWQIELAAALADLRARLDQVQTHSRVISTLSQDAEVSKLTHEIAALKEETAKLAARPIPDRISDADVSEATRQFEIQNQTLEGLNATLKQNEALLHRDFKAQRDKLRAAADAARAFRQQIDGSYEATLKSADTEAARQLARIRRRAAGARVAAFDSARLAAELDEKRTQQENERLKLRRDALEPHVAALRLRMTSLIEGKSRTRAERLERRLASAGLPIPEQIYLQIQLLKEKTIGRLNSDYGSTLRERFTASELQDLVSRGERDRRYWARYRSSIARRYAAETLEAFQGSVQELNDAQAELNTLQKKLDQCISEQRALDVLESHALDEFAKLQNEFKQSIGAAADQKSIKWSQEIGQAGLDMRLGIEAVYKLESEVLERLTQGMREAEGRVALWEEANSRLYWSRLITRGASAFDGTAYRNVRDEIQALTLNRWQTALAQAGSEFTQQLVNSAGSDRVAAGLWALGVLIAGDWLYRRCRRYRPGAIVTDDASDAQTPPLTARLRARGARVGRTAVPVLTLLAAVASAIAVIGLVGVPRRLSIEAVGIVGGIVTVESLLRLLFHADKARNRVIPCSSVVARHYRRYARVLLVLAILFIAPVRILAAFEFATTTRQVLIEWFQLFALFIAWLFFVRRETVLNVFPRAQRGRMIRTIIALRSIFPLFPILLPVLILAHLAGYVALTTYVSVGILATLLLAVAGSMLFQLLRELLRAIWKQFERVHEVVQRTEAAVAESDAAASGTAAAPPPIPEPSEAPGATVEPTAPADRIPQSLRIVLSIVRALMTLAVIVGALRVWGVRPYEIKALLDIELWLHGDQVVTLWRVGGSILAVVTAVIISRAARQALRTQFYPRHLTIDRGAQAAIDTLLHYACLLLGVYIGLQTLRLDFGALSVLFGALGLGIGLGLQQLIVNFISGLLMLFERHVRVGDFIMVNGKLSEVTRVAMRSTTLRTPEGVHLIIPNGEFINQRVENWTLYDQPIRDSVDVYVTQDSDPQAVRDLLLEIARGNAHVLHYPPPQAEFVDLSHASLHFSLNCWFRSLSDRGRGIMNLRYSIDEKFRAKGITLV